MEANTSSGATARVLRTNHTGLTVSDLHRTLAYFRDALAFEVTSMAPRDPGVIQAITGVAGAGVRIAYVRGGSHNLELIEYTGPADRVAVRPRPCDTGFAHLAYDVEGIDRMIEKLGEYGVLPIAPPVAITGGPNAGKKAVYLRDWDGVTIELIGSA